MSEGICRTLYTYDGAGGGEITTLTFKEGEIINLFYSSDEGWWEGELNGKRGWFPATYVTKVQESDTSSTCSDDWTEVKTPNGQIYYVNTKTNESAWELPKNVKLQERKSPNEIIAPVASLTLDLTPNYTQTKTGSSESLQVPTATHASSEPSTPQHIKSSGSFSKHAKSQPSTPQSLKASPSTRSRSSTPPTPGQANGLSPKPHIRMHNGISYPDDKEAKEQSLLQPGKFSYCDYFWSDRVENHSFQSGFSVLYQKMLKGKQMSKEMAELIKQREAVEIQYSKGLLSIANSVLASQEGGTLGETWKKLKETAAQEAQIHQDFANKLRAEVERPLLENKEDSRKDLKKLEASMSDLRKQVQLKCQATERAKQLLHERGKDLELKMNSMKFTREEVNKAKRKSVKQAEELTHTVEAYNHIRQQWFEEMVTSSLILERHEEARVEAMKKVISHYTAILQDTRNKCHETGNTIKQQLAVTSPDKDRELWVRKNATGKIKPVDLII